MEKLDVKYLSGLVEKSQAGSSNAFAELYTATYRNEYAYAYELLKSEELAKEALKRIYVRALQEINKLKEPDLCLSWLYDINFSVCREIRNSDNEEDDMVNIDGKKYRMTQISKNLPISEGQILIMHYFRGYSFRQIRDLLGFTRYEIKGNLYSGKDHLRQLMQE